MTTEATHHPGPWRLKGIWPDQRIVAPDHGLILKLGGDSIEPDAWLAAAAPTMYEALEKAQGIFQRYIDRVGASETWATDVRDAIDAAIAMAKGERL